VNEVMHLRRFTNYCSMLVKQVGFTEFRPKLWKEIKVAFKPKLFGVWCSFACTTETGKREGASLCSSSPFTASHFCAHVIFI
jgi:hypothetical protein